MTNSGSQNGPSLDVDALARLREAAGNPPGFIGELVEAFVADVATDLAELADALQDAKLKRVARIAHRMRSTTTNLGAVRLSELLQRLEDDAVREDTPATSERAQAVRAEFPVAEEALRDYLTKNAGA